MDYRMNNIGSKIISNYDYSNLTKPTYPFPKPSITQRQYDPPSNYFSYPHQPPHPMFSPPIYNNSYMNQTRKRVYNSLLREKIDELEDALLERQSMRKERTLLQVHSLGSLGKTSTGDETSIEMLKIMNRQQDLLGDLARTVQTLGEKVNFPQSSVEYGVPLPKNYSQSTRNVEGGVRSKKEILEELEIESDDDPEIFRVDDENYNSVPGSRRGLGSVGSLAKPKLIPHRLKGRKRFRALVWAILFPVFAFNLINKRKNHLKRDYISEMGSSISHFKKIASKWVLLYTKEPILSILKDSSLDLDITGKDVWYSKGVPKALNTKIQKIHVRLKAFFTGLIEGTTREIVPKNLLFFFEKFINNGAFIPEDFFVPYEKARLDFDKFGALIRQNDEKKGMLLVFFLVSKILVSMFLMKPAENMLPVAKGGNVGMYEVLRNLKVIASILQAMVLLKFVRVNRSSLQAVEEENEILTKKSGFMLSSVSGIQRIDDKISQDLIKISEMEVFFQKFKPLFNSIQDLMTQWVEKLIKISENSISSVFK